MTKDVPLFVTVLKGTDFPGNSRFCYCREGTLCTIKIGKHRVSSSVAQINSCKLL